LMVLVGAFVLAIPHARNYSDFVGFIRISGNFWTRVCL
jgi:hypothetical protein